MWVSVLKLNFVCTLAFLIGVYWRGMVLSLPMFNEECFLKNDEFIDNHMLAVKCMNKSDFLIEEALLMIGYVIRQCLGLFCLMVCVRICEIVIWHNELGQCDQDIDVVWLNIGDDQFACSWSNFDENVNFVEKGNFNVAYEFFDARGVYSPKAPLIVRLCLQEAAKMKKIPLEERKCGGCQPINFFKLDNFLLQN